MENKLSEDNFQKNILSKAYKLYKTQYVSNNDFDNSESNKKIKKAEKGEVLTPLPMVFNMLEKLPYYLWTKSNYKWLDPVVGDGHFMIIIYLVLMETLSDKEFMHDKKFKSTHIIKNMLFMNDVNQDNCRRTISLFYLIEPEASINIRSADFLKITPLSYWDTQFDIIVMNPPYNLDGIKSKGQKNVWVYFSQMAFTLLKKSGYFLAIHPSSWRINEYTPWGTKVNIYDLYQSKNILYISMYTIWQTFEMMGVQINIDYLLIHNDNSKVSYIDKNKNISTQVIDIENIYGEKNKIDIRNNMVIANFGHLIINKLLLLCEKYGSLHSLLYHTSELHHDLWKKKKIAEGPYKIIHLMKKKGKTIYMSERKHTHQETPKIIINGFGVKYVYFDKVGEYGVTDTPFILLTNNENIYNMLSTTVWNFIVNALGILGNNLNERIFLYIPNIATILKKSEHKDDKIVTENEMFDLLEIFGDEREKIKTFKNNNVQNLKMKDRIV